MGSKVVLAPGLEETIALDARDRAVEVFLTHGMLVLDDVEWRADMALLRSSLVKKKRAFKDPYIVESPTHAVRKAVMDIVRQAHEMFPRLYPRFPSEMPHRISWRPMITGPEPMHFDTFDGVPLITAYVNVSPEPRVYRIGPNLPALIRSHGPELRALMVEHKVDDLSYVLRMLAAKGQGPMAKTPRHRVDLAPGAIWFFNAKTVSHEVVYGSGAVGMSWEVPNCGVKLQTDLLKELL